MIDELSNVGVAAIDGQVFLVVDLVLRSRLEFLLGHDARCEDVDVGSRPRRSGQAWKQPAELVSRLIATEDARPGRRLRRRRPGGRRRRLSTGRTERRSSGEHETQGQCDAPSTSA